jgi:hypothetical protein
MKLTVLFASLKWIKRLKLWRIVQLAKNISILSVLQHGKLITLHVLYAVDRLLGQDQEQMGIPWGNW